MSNRVALVTGGAQGIGKGIATALGQDGFKVAVADLNLEVAEQTAKEISAAGGEAIAVQVDVTSTASVADAVATIEKELGPVEVVVNNAGFDDFMPFVKTTEEFWERILDVNFKGHLRVIQAVVPGMVERGFGRIVAVSSTAGLKGYAYVSAYCAAKHAVVGLVRALALETVQKGVTVNAVCPGYTETDLVKDSFGRVSEKTGRPYDDVIHNHDDAVHVIRHDDKGIQFNLFANVCR